MEGKKVQDFLHEIGQERWEEIRIQEGLSPKEARARFMKEFRKNYLEEIKEDE